MRKRDLSKIYHEDIYGNLNFQNLINDCLKKINLKNPTINAVVSLNPVLKDHVTEIENKNRDEVGFLKGIPVLIKDTILTNFCKTTAGDPDLKDYLPNKNAIVIDNLRNDDGIILAKTNTPRRALDVQTYNPLFGVTVNPYNSKLTSGGSSGGTAAAISSGMAHLGFGSDLVGSLRIPASFCGIYSLRPTESLVNSDGHIPPVPANVNIPSELTIGPMASSIFGLQLLMASLTSIYNLKSNIFSEGLEINKLDVNLLITPQFAKYPVDQLILQSLKEMSGKCKEENILTTTLEPNFDFHKLIITHKKLSKTVLHDDLNQENQTMVSNELIEDKLNIENQVDEILKDYTAWILPVCSVLPFLHNYNHKPLLVNGTRISYWRALISYTTIFSVSGHPVLTLPISMKNGLPIGVQIVGKKYQERKLLRLGSILESVFSSTITPPSFPVL